MERRMGEENRSTSTLQISPRVFTKRRIWAAGNFYLFGVSSKIPFERFIWMTSLRKSKRSNDCLTFLTGIRESPLPTKQWKEPCRTFAVVRKTSKSYWSRYHIRWPAFPMNQSSTMITFRKPSRVNVFLNVMYPTRYTGLIGSRRRVGKDLVRPPVMSYPNRTAVLMGSPTPASTLIPFPCLLSERTALVPSSIGYLNSCVANARIPLCPGFAHELHPVNITNCE